MEKKYIILPIEGEQIPAKTPISKTHLKGLYKLAFVILNKNSSFVPFESTYPEKQINGMIDYMYPNDRAAILVILKIFAFLPKFKIRWIMLLVEAGAKWPSFFGAAFRMLQIGLKGLVFTLYYADFTENKSIHKQIKWDAKIIMD
jgi:hypothetical protein